MERGGSNNNEIAQKALCMACFEGNVRVMKYLLSCGVSVNSQGIIIIIVNYAIATILYNNNY